MAQTRQTNLQGRIMLALVGLVFCSVGAYAIFVTVQGKEPEYARGAWGDYEPGDWIDTPWTMQAPELEEIKEKAEALGKKGEASARQLVSLAKSARLSYKHHPSAENLFAWATYAYEAGRWSVDKHFGDDKENFPRDSDFHDHGPMYADVYIYARARYLRENPNGSIHEFGRRVLAENPDDRDVQLALVRGAGAWSDESERFGRKVAEELLAKYPNDPMTLFAAGRCHWSFWFTKRRKSDWEKGIAQCEKFISLAPQDLNSVIVAKRLVAMMKKDGYKSSE